MAADTDNIVAVSIPYMAGVVAAAAMPLGSGAYWTLALALSVGIVPMFISASRRKSGRASFYILFFLLGAVNYAAWASSPQLSHQGKLFFTASKAMDWLQELISQAGFRNDSTSSLLQALFTGRKSSLDKSIIETFRISGASHILALSGLHLGIIYGIISGLLTALGRSTAARIAASYIIVLCCGFYTMMTGAGPSVCRALIFIIIREIQKFSPGRRCSAAACLSISLMVHTTVNPGAVGSLGFQLSYLAVTGVLLVYPKLKEWAPEGRFNAVSWLWNASAMSISCQIFTAPLIWWKFRSFPTYFLITNIISLPVTELLMICSVLCLGLEAAGICPEAIKNLCDILAQILIESLGIIAEL